MRSKWAFSIQLETGPFSARHSLIHYLQPYFNVPANDHLRLLGKYSNCNNRENVHCIFDCKWRINLEAFDDVYKHLQITEEEFLDTYGMEVRLKGVLFDVSVNSF